MSSMGACACVCCALLSSCALDSRAECDIPDGTYVATYVTLPTHVAQLTHTPPADCEETRIGVWEGDVCHVTLERLCGSADIHYELRSAASGVWRGTVTATDSTGTVSETVTLLLK